MATREATKRPVPTEDVEQICLFRWAEYQSGKYRSLMLMYHIPNGGKRSKAESGRFRVMGVKPGVPDICLPVVSNGPDGNGGNALYFGLYIELKRQRGGTVSHEQKEWVRDLRAEGYAVEVCKGWEAAAKVITDYLEGWYTPLYKP